MRKRWIIRSIFIGLLTFCVVAWVGSCLCVIRAGHPRSGMYAILADHRINLGRNCDRRHEPAGYHPPSGWIEVDRLNLSSGEQFWASSDKYTDWHFMGFSYLGYEWGWDTTMPLYFPTLLSALLLWFGWRKTKSKAVGGAFPAEPAKAEVKSTP